MLYCYSGNNEELHFMQGTAPPYLALSVRAWLVNHITDRWIGHRGLTEWRWVKDEVCQ